ncbi:MAG: FIST C-terminal domain-containing protein [Myxococcales bacterium]|nr:FIST C-terminal domain-containing protein [Myxococcales bacterium]
MTFVSCLSRAQEPADVLVELLEQAGEVEPDVIFVFVTPSHARDLSTLVGALREAFDGVVVFGCTASGVVGGGQEHESDGAVSATFAHMPGVSLTPWHARRTDLSDDEWARLVGPSPQGILLIGNPFTSDITDALAGLQRIDGGVVIAGGQAGGGRRGAGAALVADEVHTEGIVGLSLSGNVRMDAVVAQGCRPVGAPMFVTACEGNRITSLDGRDPIVALRTVHEDLSAADRELFRRAFFLGVQMRDQQEYRQGDFLIRNIVGVPKEGGGLVVAFQPERFAVVQAHLRDASAARADLDAVLQRHASETTELDEPAAALLFTCVGRGEGLFGEVGHDSAAFADVFGEVPIGGMFCNGEIGPVQGEIYLHGYTAVFVTFRAVPPS